MSTQPRFSLVPVVVIPMMGWPGRGVSPGSRSIPERTKGRRAGATTRSLATEARYAGLRESPYTPDGCGISRAPGPPEPAPPPCVHRGSGGGLAATAWAWALVALGEGLIELDAGHLDRVAVDDLRGNDRNVVAHRRLQTSDTRTYRMQCRSVRTALDGDINPWRWHPRGGPGDLRRGGRLRVAIMPAIMACEKCPKRRGVLPEDVSRGTAMTL